MEFKFMHKLRSANLENMRSLGARVSRETSLRTDTELYPSRTIQSAKDDADINVIVKRFGVTGTTPPVARLPSYGDYTGVSDFQTAMNVVRQAEEAFMLLPADVRSKFGNSPQAFLEYASDSENIDSLRKMGLAIPKVDDTITPEPEITPAPKGSKSNARSSGVGAGKAPKASAQSDGDGDGE